MIEVAQALLAVASIVAVVGVLTGAVWLRRRVRGEPASPWLLAPLAALAFVFGALTILSFPFELSAQQTHTESRQLTPP